MPVIEPTFVPTGADGYTTAGGPWDVPTLDRLVWGCADDSAEAVVDGQARLTFAELRSRSGRLAATLAGLGVEPGAVATFQFVNRHETLLAYLACWRLGAVAVPIHGRAGPGEMASAGALVEPALHLHGRDHTAPPGFPSLDVDADSRDSDMSNDSAQASRNPGDVAAVLFTAGSSGTPKAVLHTHRTLGCKARQMVDVHGLTTDDVVLMPAPLAHVSGLLNGALVPWAAGMKTVLMTKWDTARALDLIEEEGVSFMVGPPTFFTGLLADPAFAPERVASLRLISSGGAGVTEAFAKEAADRLGCVVKRSYGSTEAPTVATTPAEMHDDEHAATTEGRATPGTQLRVVDPTTAAELSTAELSTAELSTAELSAAELSAAELSAAEPPEGEEGELQVAGPEVFAGYLDPDATAEATTGDWFRTGDLARIDEDGWLTIIGRLTDVIIRGGENISPAEVTSVLDSHPAVEQAVVIGFPDDRLGERVAAFAVASTPFDLGTCRAWFESQGISRFKWPEVVEQLDEIPLLPAGKPDLAALRALALRR